MNHEPLYGDATDIVLCNMNLSRVSERDIEENSGDATNMVSCDMDSSRVSERDIEKNIPVSAIQRFPALQDSSVQNVVIEEVNSSKHLLEEGYENKIANDEGSLEKFGHLVSKQHYICHKNNVLPCLGVVMSIIVRSL